MAKPWVNALEPVSLGQPGSVITLVEGSTFSVSGRTGDMEPDHPQGLFFLDTRFLSQYLLLVDGLPTEPLDVIVREPFSAVFVGRVPPVPGHAPSQLVIVRERWVSRGMREDLRLHNYGTETARCRVALLVDADFAGLFEVKEGRIVRQGEYFRDERSETSLRFLIRRDGVEHCTHIGLSVPLTSPGPGAAEWEVQIPPRGAWQVCIEARLQVDRNPVPPRFTCARPPREGLPSERMQRWRAALPNVRTEYAPLAAAVRQAGEDLGVLRMFDPEHPDLPVVAAGAPWFMTLFGRDSIITAWMARLVDPSLAHGVLHTLARLQGSRIDPETEEEPGRILHEARFSGVASPSLSGARVYYGTVDATPLFVMLLGELLRWGLNIDDVATLMPHADRALRWILEYGDRDGDGYVEYQRATDKGLANQGWKDSWDGVRFADGGLAQPPIALCEVQAYVYAAFVARAHLAWEAGEEELAAGWARRATSLRERFNAEFWLPDRGWYALALDGNKRPVDALASNMGHCLWAGIVDEDKARAVADRLVSDQLFSGYGLRTLASSMAAYDPVSYHNGSVWPHDTALAVSGLMRYGFVEHAQHIALGLLDVAQARGGGLPELFCGFAREEFGSPVAYPTSCSPQAWAAASALLLTRALLRLDPWCPQGRVHIAPALPEEIRRLEVGAVPVAGARVDIVVEGDSVEVRGLPDGLKLVQEPRGPLSAVLPVGPRTWPEAR